MNFILINDIIYGIICMIDYRFKITDETFKFYLILNYWWILFQLSIEWMLNYLFMGKLKFIIIRYLWIIQRLIDCLYN